MNLPIASTPRGALLLCLGDSSGSCPSDMAHGGREYLGG
jgi:hypothetical protein